jgi:hypothetical protein
VRTDDGLAIAPFTPRIEDLADSAEHALEIDCLLIEKRSNVNTRRGARAPKRDDVLDLGERQPEPARLTHERQQRQDICWIATVSGGCPARRQENPARLV